MGLVSGSKGGGGQSGGHYLGGLINQFIALRQRSRQARMGTDMANKKGEIMGKNKFLKLSKQWGGIGRGTNIWNSFQKRNRGSHIGTVCVQVKRGLQQEFKHPNNSC